MPYFLRKTFDFGPFRINISKNGVGISTGVKAARTGVGSNGKTSSHVGRFGLYQRQEFVSTTYDGQWDEERDKAVLETLAPYKIAGIKAHVRLKIMSEEQIKLINDIGENIFLEIYEEGGEDMLVDQYHFQVRMLKICSSESENFWDSFDEKDEEYRREKIEEIFAALCVLNPDMRSDFTNLGVST